MGGAEGRAIVVGRLENQKMRGNCGFEEFRLSK